MSHTLRQAYVLSTLREMVDQLVNENYRKPQRPEGTDNTTVAPNPFPVPRNRWNEIITDFKQAGLKVIDRSNDRLALAELVVGLETVADKDSFKEILKSYKFFFTGYVSGNNGYVRLRIPHFEEVKKLPINENYREPTQQSSIDNGVFNQIAAHLRRHGIQSTIENGNLVVRFYDQGSHEKEMKAMKAFEKILAYYKDEVSYDIEESKARVVLKNKEETSDEHDKLNPFSSAVHSTITKVFDDMNEGRRTSQCEPKLAHEHESAKGVDPEELRMGIEIEQEHTPNKTVARQIAIDHLKELPDYYTRLAKMEKNADKLDEQVAVPAGNTLSIPISPTQAKKLSGVLSGFGIDPDTIIKHGDEEEEPFGVVGEEDEEPGDDEPKKKLSKRPPKINIEISQEAIQAAKKFFEIGQIGANWYHEAHDAINAGFRTEEDRVLFALLLASTSVQNEIYGNFIEAALMFNAIKKDVRENPELLHRFVNDEKLNVGDPQLLAHPTFQDLHLFKDTKSTKLTQVGAKMGNIKRFLKYYLEGSLDKAMVRTMLGSAVRPTPGMSFDMKDPMIRRLKIANYALTLVDPEFASTSQNPFNVVVDTWMFRIFYPENTAQGQHGKSKMFIDKLFGSNAAYANVAHAVSTLAAEAGVSPHVMQAALWTGIKKTWEGESADASNYISAIKDMIARYGDFWKDIENETHNLEAVIAKLDPTTAGKYIRDRRADRMRKIAITNAARNRAIKAAPGYVKPAPKKKASPKPPVEELQEGRSSPAFSPGFFYHATNQDNAVGIAEDGVLKTHRPWFGTDQNTWPDGSEEKRSYFADEKEKVAPFHPVEGKPVLLRVPQNAAPFKRERSTRDIYTVKPIPAQRIEYFDDAYDLWRPIKDILRPATLSLWEQNNDALPPGFEGFDDDEILPPKEKPPEHQATFLSLKRNDLFYIGKHRKTVFRVIKDYGPAKLVVVNSSKGRKLYYATQVDKNFNVGILRVIDNKVDHKRGTVMTPGPAFYAGHKDEERIIQKPITEQIRRKMDIPLPQDLLGIADLFKKAGRQFYLVGGSVRDALLGKPPKDFDLATDAVPDEVERILGQDPEMKVIPLGKAFGVIKAFTPEGNEYEIATYRKDVGKGRRPDAVEFTSIDQDVARRDLTMNALFYDIENKEIVDYVGGIEDIEKGVVRTVGDPNERFDEDRLRILRALRFAGRLGTKLADSTAQAIKTNNSLAGISGERIRDEFLKGIKSAKSVPYFLKMISEFDLWPQIFPGLQVNMDFKDIKTIPVQLGLLLRENDAKIIASKLNSLKYSSDEVSQVSFLAALQNLTPETAFKLKKLFKNSKLTDADIEEFARFTGRPSRNLLKAFIEFEPSVSGEELQSQGFTGKELGMEMLRRETENFIALL